MKLTIEQLIKRLEQEEALACIAIRAEGESICLFADGKPILEQEGLTYSWADQTYQGEFKE